MKIRIPCYLYTNYAQKGDIRFFDLLQTSRPFGSNESETLIQEEGDLAYYFQKLNNTSCYEADEMPGKGFRFYPVNKPA